MNRAKTYTVSISLVTVAMGLVGCSAPDSISSPVAPTRPRMSDPIGTCNAYGPMTEETSFGPNDCPNDPFVGTTAVFPWNMATVMTGSSPAPRSDYVWRGENLSTPEDESQCPEVLYTSVRLNWDGTWYTFPGPLFLQGPAQASRYYPGLPHGYYTQGPDDSRPVVSDDLRSQISAFQGKPQAVIACNGDYRFSVFSERVWVGVVSTVGMWGHITPYASYNRPTSFDPGGWSYGEYTYDASGTILTVRVENGAGDGWRSALDAYLSGGGCTIGWEIWVDGKQRCRSDGTAVAMA